MTWYRLMRTDRSLLLHFTATTGHLYTAERTIAGQEKHLLMAAADFCLVPSRFEPCGLVDIEFGWHGALSVGHSTGGLGKMPGVYYIAESLAKKHMSAKLVRAVSSALQLSQDERHAMMLQALGSTFPVDRMMEQYSTAWQDLQAAATDATLAASSTGRPAGSAAAAAPVTATPGTASVAVTSDALQRYAAEPGQRSFYNTWWLKRNTLNPTAYQAHKVMLWACLFYGNGNVHSS